MGAPFGFQWHLTDACDQRCRHCYLYGGGAAHAQQMSRDDMITVLGNCLEFSRSEDRPLRFFLTGGDPLLHPDFWDLAERLAAYGLPFEVMGNPFHLTREAAGRLRSLGCRRYQLSLDGLEAAHDALRGRGSFAATLGALDRLKDAGLTSCLMTTVTAENASEIPDLARLAAERGADGFAFARYCPVPGASPRMLTPQAFRDLLAVCYPLFTELARTTSTSYFKKDHLWALYEYETFGRLPGGADRAETGDAAGVAEAGSRDAASGAPVIDGGCGCGRDHLTILPDGSVMACRRLAGSVVGNALEDRLYDLWHGPMNAYRQYDRFTACSSCPLLAACRGCPAAAAGAASDPMPAASGTVSAMPAAFYAPDPQCWRYAAVSGQTKA